MVDENENISGKPPRASFVYGDLLFVRIQNVSDALLRKTDDVLRSGLGLTVNEWRVLAVVAATGNPNARSVVAETGLDKSWVSRLIQALIGRGLLRATPDPADARRKRLSLTNDGQTTLKATAALVRGLQSRLLSGFSASEHETLPRLLTRLLREMDQIGG